MKGHHTLRPNNMGTAQCTSRNHHATPSSKCAMENNDTARCFTDSACRNLCQRFYEQTTSNRKQGTSREVGGNLELACQEFRSLLTTILVVGKAVSLTKLPVGLIREASTHIHTPLWCFLMCCFYEWASPQHKQPTIR